MPVLSPWEHPRVKYSSTLSHGQPPKPALGLTGARTAPLCSLGPGEALACASPDSRTVCSIPEGGAD